MTLISLVATFVKREALDTDQFKQTSRELIANPAIQEQVAAQLADAFITNVDVTAELQAALPPNLQGLAGPIAGVTQGVVDNAAQEILTRPRVQETFVELASASQAALVRVLNGETKLVDTSEGNVVLDLQPLVLKLGDRFGFVSGLADKLPQGSAQITILEPENLKMAQTVTHRLEQVANWVWILAVAAWVGAIWLARGRRRQEVRALGIGLAVVGVLVLGVRWLAGEYFVNELVRSETVRPAASEAWQIITQGLADSGWVALAVGVLVALGAWLVGPGAHAEAARAAVAPGLRQPGVAWGAFAVGMVLLVWILPMQMFRTTVILVVASAIGFVVFQRQVAAEAASDVDESLPAAR